MRLLLLVLLPVAGAASCTNAEADADPAVDAAPSPIDAMTDADAGRDGAASYFPAECAEGMLCDAPNPFPNVYALTSIVGRGRGDVWVSGAGGSVGHFDGVSWSRHDLPSRITVSLWQGAEHLWAFHDQLAYARVEEANGMSTWSATHTKMSTYQNFYRPITYAWGTSESNLWIVSATEGDSALFRAQLSARPGEPSESVLEYAGESSSTRPYPLRVFGVGEDLWLVGRSGVALRRERRDGAFAFVRVETHTDADLTGLWGCAPDDIWAVGGGGTIRHYRGDAAAGWESVPSPTSEGLTAIWGTAADDVWTVGHDATAIHWDGARWSRVAIGGIADRSQKPPLYAIWASASDDVWAVGEGIVLRSFGAVR